MDSHAATRINDRSPRKSFYGGTFSKRPVSTLCMLLSPRLRAQLERISALHHSGLPVFIKRRRKKIQAMTNSWAASFHQEYSILRREGATRSVAGIPTRESRLG